MYIPMKKECPVVTLNDTCDHDFFSTDGTSRSKKADDSFSANKSHRSVSITSLLGFRHPKGVGSKDTIDELFWFCKITFLL